jgi:hypothetical protein
MTDKTARRTPNVERISLRAPEGFGRKLKMAAAEEGVPAGVLIDRLLDARQSRLADLRKRQPSPLHRPRDEDFGHFLR